MEDNVLYKGIAVLLKLFPPEALVVLEDLFKHHNEKFIKDGLTGKGDWIRALGMALADLAKSARGVGADLPGTLEPIRFASVVKTLAVEFNVLAGYRGNYKTYSEAHGGTTPVPNPPWSEMPPEA